MRMTWCRVRLGDNEANKKEMQMKRAASKEPGTGVAAGRRLRQREDGEDREGFLLPIFPL